MDASPPETRLPRRDVLRYFAAVAAAAALPDHEAVAAAPALAQGYGTDPDLTQIHARGDVWPLTMRPGQRATATAFADVLMPADHLGPAASHLRVTDFIDEWISAPYPDQQRERPILLAGFAWLEDEATRRFNKAFPALTTREQHAIVDDICRGGEAAAEFKKPARFFVLCRSLVMAAYYGTPEGWKAIGYIGNITMATFDGPPQTVLDQLGLVQTVK